jgi:HPt (histidine-containing phosphotransfer) domain-containing protein
MRNEELGMRNGYSEIDLNPYPSSSNDNPHSSLFIPHSSFVKIPGVDTAKGIIMTGGKERSYRAVLSMFRKDAEERLPALQAVPCAQALPLFITQVHALKSASASIGAADVSALAAELEAAGKAGDMALVGNRLPVFAGKLAELVKGISAALEGGVGAAHNWESPQALPVFIALLRELEAALKAENVKDIDRVMEELNNKQTDSKTAEGFEQVSDCILMAEYDGAIAAVEKMISLSTLSPGRGSAH